MWTGSKVIGPVGGKGTDRQTDMHTQFEGQQQMTPVCCAAGRSKWGRLMVAAAFHSLWFRLGRLRGRYHPPQPLPQQKKNNFTKLI